MAGINDSLKQTNSLLQENINGWNKLEQKYTTSIQVLERKLSDYAKIVNKTLDFNVTTENLQKQINNIKSAFGSLNKGDLNKTIRTSFKDEIDALMNQFLNYTNLLQRKVSTTHPLDGLKLFDKKTTDDSISNIHKVFDATTGMMDVFGRLGKDGQVVGGQITNVFKQMDSEVIKCFEQIKSESNLVPNTFKEAIGRVSASMTELTKRRMTNTGIDIGLKQDDILKIKQYNEELQHSINYYKEWSEAFKGSQNRKNTMPAERLADTTKQFEANVDAIKSKEKEIEYLQQQLKNTALGNASDVQKVANLNSEYNNLLQRLENLKRVNEQVVLQHKAGLISDESYNTQISRISEVTRNTVSEISQFDTSLSGTLSKETKAVSDINSLYEKQRKLISDKADIEQKAAKNNTTIDKLGENYALYNQINAELEKTSLEIQNITSAWKGNGEVENAIAKQEIENTKQKIALNERLAQINAPSTTLHTSQGDVMNYSGAERAQLALLRERESILDKITDLEIKKNTSSLNSLTPEDNALLQQYKERLDEIYIEINQINESFNGSKQAAEKAFRVTSAEQSKKRIDALNKTTVDYANNLRRTARSYTELKQVAEAYRNILNNTDPHSEKFVKLSNALREVENQTKRVEKQMGVAKNSMNGVANALSQIGMGFGVYFNWMAVSDFIKKLVEVRGELELQQVALRSILQDKEEADQIYSETLQNALKSPFKIRDLIKYTKQLAAYRVENDKLVDTTKRLADVSAGLGIDMQRLILAYGQVKAANYLRASEVRQFTEAGINMYGELSKYFTELKGTAVSTADVVDMVSKRLVKFEDVEEIFKRMTDEGGTFYNMQEIQSETLKGQIMKLHDAFDLMLNTIGQDKQGVIMTLVKQLQNLIKHWKSIRDVMYVAIGALSLYKITMMSSNLAMNTFNASLSKSNIGIMRFVNALDRMITNTRLANKKVDALGNRIYTTGVQASQASAMLNGFRAVLESIAVNAAVLAFLGLVTKAISDVVNKTREAKEEQRELDNAVNEVTNEENESIKKFRELTNVIKSNNSTQKERQKALENIKSLYADIIPQDMLEEEYILSHKNSYEAAEKAMRSYYEESRNEKRLSVATAQAQENINDILGEKVIGGWTKDTNDYNAIMKEYLQKYVDAVNKYIADGLDFSEAEQKAKEEWKKSFLETFKDVDSSQLNSLININEERIRKINQQFYRIDEAQKEFNNSTSYNTRSASRVEKEALANAGEYIDAITEIFSRYNKGENINDLIDSYSKDLPKLTKFSQKIVEAAGSGLKEATLSNYVKQYFLEEKINSISVAKEISEEAYKALVAQRDALQSELNDLLLKNHQGKFRQDREEELRQTIKDLDVQIANSIDEEKNSVRQKLQSAINELSTDFSTAWNKTVEDVFNKHNVAEENIPKTLVADASSTPENMFKEVKAQYDALTEKINNYKWALNSGKAALANFYLTQEALTKGLKEATNFQAALNDLMYKEQDKNKPTNTTAKDPFRERLDIIKEMNEEYKKLNEQVYSSDKAKLRVAQDYEKAFRAAFKGVKNIDAIWNTVKDNITDNESMITAIESMRKLVNKKNLPEFEKTISKLKVEIEVDSSEKARKEFEDSMNNFINDFDLISNVSDYDVPSDVALKLLGIDNPQTLETLRQKVKEWQDELTNNKQWSEKSAELAKKINDSIDKLEDKRNKENIKKYSKYLTEAMTERMKIYKEYEEDIQGIETTFNGDENEELRTSAIKNREKEFDTAMQEQAWKEFKESEWYQEMMSDFDNKSIEYLTALKEQLVLIQQSSKNISAKGMKEIVSDIEKIDDILIKRNSTKALFNYGRDAFGYLSQKDNLFAEQAEQMNKYTEAQKKESEAEEEYGKELAKNKSLFGTENQIGVFSNYGNNLRKAQKEWQDAKNDVETAKEKLDETTNSIQKGEKALQNYYEALEAAKNDWEQVVDICQSGATLVNEVFSDDGDVAQEYIDGLASMGKTAVNMVENISKLAATGGSDITAWLNLIAEAIQMLSELYKILSSDTRFEKQIEKLQTALDQLSYEYDKIADKMDKAMNFSSYVKDYEDGLENIKQQYENVSAQLRAERAKKNSDDSEIQDYEQQLDELEEKEEELRQKLITDFGGIGEENYRSQAESFVDAWLDAFKETGDGLSGLQETFEDFVDSFMKKQMAMRIADAFLDSYMREIDDYISATNGNVDMGIISDKFAQLKNALPELSAMLEEFANAMDWSSLTDNGLSGLQQGIEGITESTAEVLEGYLNSIRFYVADDNECIKRISLALTDVTGLSSPIISELKQQTSILNSINNKLSTVISAGNGAKVSGYYLKVYDGQ